MKKKEKKSSCVSSDIASNVISKEAVEQFFKGRHAQGDVLLKNIKKNMPELEPLLKEASEHWKYEDPVYRYYHGSFKVYYVCGLTEKIVKMLKKISPHDNKDELNKDFLEILNEGTQIWVHDHNKEWSKRRPMLEAFFHARFFLEMAVKYGKELEEAPSCLPSGWAALLYLYNIR